jgi:hypothetical protein
MPRGELLIELGSQSSRSAYRHGKADNDAPLGHVPFGVRREDPASERKHMLVGVNSAPGDEYAVNNIRLSDRRLGLFFQAREVRKPLFD